MAANPFDQFDTIAEKTQEDNPFDQFDEGGKPAGFFKNAGKLAIGGAKRLTNAAPLVDDVLTGKFDADAANRIAEGLKPEADKPPELQQVADAFAPYTKKWNEAKGFGESAKVLGGVAGTIAKQALTNPKGLAYATAEQAANMAPAMGGMLAGGQLGGMVGGPLGAAAGALAGAFAGGWSTEAGLEVVGYVGKELQARNLAPTEENIHSLLQDQNVANNVIGMAQRKASGTAGVDALLTVLGGRVATAPGRAAQKAAIAQLGAGASREAIEAATKANLQATSKLSRAGYGLAGGAIDVVGEGASEAAGQKYATGEVDMADVGMEAAMGLGGAAPSVIAAGRALSTHPRSTGTAEQSVPPTPQPNSPLTNAVSSAAGWAHTSPATEDPGLTAWAAQTEAARAYNQRRNTSAADDKRQQENAFKNAEMDRLVGEYQNQGAGWMHTERAEDKSQPFTMRPSEEVYSPFSPDIAQQSKTKALPPAPWMHSSTAPVADQEETDWTKQTAKSRQYNQEKNRPQETGDAAKNAEMDRAVRQYQERSNAGWALTDRPEETVTRRKGESIKKFRERLRAARVAGNGENNLEAGDGAGAIPGSSAGAGGVGGAVRGRDGIVVEREDRQPVDSVPAQGAVETGVGAGQAPAEVAVGGETVLSGQEMSDNVEQAQQKEGAVAENETGAATSTVDTAAAEAALSPKNNLPEPTDGQKEAGNYKKGHVSFHGLDISIENPAGSVRSGTDPDGKRWETPMRDHYGYIKGTVGKDKDHLDVFIPENYVATDRDKVAVVDQIDPKTGKFDEHKIIFGSQGEAAVRTTYLRNYDATGATRIGAITMMPIKEFKEWMASGNTKKPVGKIADRPSGETVTAPSSGEASVDLTVSGSRRNLPGNEDLWYTVHRSLDNQFTVTVGHHTDTRVARLYGKGDTSEAAYKRAVGQLRQDIRDKMPDGAKDGAKDGVKTPANETEETTEKHPVGKEADGVKNGEPDGAKPQGKGNAESLPKPTDKENLTVDEPTLVIRSLETGKQEEVKISDLKGQLDDFKAQAKEQGQVVDDRLLQKIKQTERAIAEEQASKPGHGQFAGNTIFTADKVAAARARLKAKRGTLSSGFDPELMHDVFIIGGAHFEAGARKFAAWSKAVLADIGNEFKPYLAGAYENLRRYPGLDTEGMSTAAEVDEAIGEGEQVKAEPKPAQQEPATATTTAKPELSIQENVELTSKYGTRSYLLVTGNTKDHVARIKGAGKWAKWLPSRTAWRFPMSEAGSVKRRLADLLASPERETVESAVSAPDPLTLSQQASTINQGDAERVPVAEKNEAQGGQGDVIQGNGQDVSEGEQPARVGAPEGGREGDAVSEGGGKGVRRTGAISDSADDGKPAGRPDREGAGTQHGPDDSAGSRGKRPERVPSELLTAGQNYRITEADSLGKGGAKQKARDNLKAIRILKRLQQEGRPATQEEQAALVKYVGWGASELANGMFPQRRWDHINRKSVDSYKEGWEQLGSELRDLLNDEEYAAAKTSTLNAHYTSEKIIKGMYSALERLGFKGKGRILEPGSGVGHFIGLLPDTFTAGSRFTAVEMDPISAGIAKALYPGHDIRNADFAKFQAPNNFFDIALGNPPFADIEILNDPDYAANKFFLHDFFFAKSIDKVRPGGLMVLVTSKGTMDKSSDKARSYLSKRADLIGAIRLPQTAFKENAGTEVVTDVIFLRKRKEGEQPSGQAWKTLKEIKTADGKEFYVNEYFADHPEMVLGRHSSAGSMYGPGQYTVEPKAGDIADHFAKAVEKLPADIYQKDNSAPTPTKEETIEAEWSPEAVKEGSYYLDEKGQLRQKERGRGEAVTGVSKKQAVIKSFVKVRDAVRQVLYVQLKGEGDLQAAQRDLDRAYGAFVKEHGPINKATTITRTDKKTGEESVSYRYPNFSYFKNDPDAYLVAAIEKYDTETGEATKSDIFTKRVISPTVEPKIESLVDALHVSLHQTGEVDILRIAEMMGVDEAAAIEGLSGAIYLDPNGARWVTADEYLSGNVRKKLVAAKAAAEIDPKYRSNIAALQAVIPEDLPPSRIKIALGMPVVTPEDVSAFAAETISLGVTVRHNTATGDWTVVKRSGYRTFAAVNDYGTERMDAADLIEVALNNRAIKLYFRDRDGKQIFDKDATEAAYAKLQKIKDKFSVWVWEDEERAARLSRKYNDQYNSTVKREYGGDHVKHMQFPGMTNIITPHEHQKRVAWRIVQRGNTYMAHSVGAGKTIGSIIAGMELKRLGIKKKPMWVVPNHMLKQFSTEFQELYPSAKLLVADEEQFTKENRNRFMGRIAAENWDGIIITHSAFGIIPMNAEYQRQFIDEQLAELAELHIEARGDRTRTKQLERQMRRLEQRLEKILNNASKDKGVSFEESGIDQLFVDEAHYFRKLDFVTNQTNISGIDPSGSVKAFDLYVKSRYLESLYPGRSLVLMSGTPVTNTMGEVFTLQRYLSEPAMRELGIHNFDAWASTFGETVTELVSTPAGTYQPKTRFGRFRNMPALASMWAEIGDFVHAKDLPYLKRPAVVGGGRDIVIGESSELQKQYKKALAVRLEAIKNRKGPPQRGDDIVLTVITDGRHAALDDRFIAPNAVPRKDSKTELAIGKVFDIWEQTKDKRSTQMIFADLGLPGAESKRGFSLYTNIKQELIRRGIPENEIAFMQDYKKSDEKQKLFNAMNRGDVRILIGSSQAMGTGVNAHKKLVALHHFDADEYLPANIEQREGRIVRQGNENDKVNLFIYVTRGSYDETMWQFIESKQRFIDQFLAGSVSEDSVDDIDGAANQYAEARALSSDNPLVLELAGLENEISKLESLRRAHADSQQRMAREKAYSTERIKAIDKFMPQLEQAMAARVDTSGKNFSVELFGKTFAERKAAGERLVAMLKDQAKSPKPIDREEVGKIGGFTLMVSSNPLDPRGLILRVKHGKFVSSDAVKEQYQAEAIKSGLAEEPSPVGLAMKIENLVKGLDSFYQSQVDAKAKAEHTIKEADNRIGAKFEHADALQQKRARADEIRRLLEAEGKKEGDQGPQSTDEVRFSSTSQPLPESDRANIPEEFRAAFGSLRARVLMRQVQVLKSQEEAKALVKRLGGRLSAAWHGSPHDFDEFRMSAVGTGEGNQAYGHGLYFASKRDVAEYYRGTLSAKKDGAARGTLETAFPGRLFSDKEVLEIRRAGRMTEEDSPAKVEARRAQYRLASIRDLDLDVLSSVVGQISDNLKGRLYAVELAPQEDDYLLWDRPLSEQSEKVKAALEKAGYSHPQIERREYEDVFSDIFGEKAEINSYQEALAQGFSEKEAMFASLFGSSLYGKLEDKLGSDRAASEYLHSLGIRGIKYLDGTSRSKGEGAYNYVILDESDIEITAKYSKDGAIQGIYANGKVYLVADGIKKGQVVPVLLHEMGEHASRLGFAQDAEYQSILKSLEARQHDDTNTGKAIRAALARVPEDTKPEHKWSEVAAYLIENNANSKIGLVRRILAFFKRWLYKAGRINADKLTVEDLVLFARSATLTHTGATYRGMFSEFLANTAEAMTPQLTPALQYSRAEVQRHAKAFYSKLQQVAADKFGGMKAQSVEPFLLKQGVKKAEIEATGLREWLAAMKPTDKVTKEQLADFVRANTVEFEDVVLGEKPNDQKLIDEAEARGDWVERDRLTQLYSEPEETRPTHFDKYTEPGAIPGSYREMFVTAPLPAGKITVRQTKRGYWFVETAEGRTKGRGYETEAEALEALAFYEDQGRGQKSWQDGHPQYSDIETPIVRIRFNEVAGLNGERILRVEEMQGPSPENQAKMPKHLKDNIYQTGVKRILAYAKENGFDGVALATKPGRTAGETQADRYSLEKHIERIEWSGEKGNRTWAATKGENVVASGLESEAEAYLGKEIARKIIDTEGLNGEITGIDLRVGGEGLKQLYDTDLPNIFKAWGGQRMGSLGGMPFLPVSEKTADSFPMFSRALPQTATAAFKRWFGNSKITKDGEPHILYHGTQHPHFLKAKEYPWVFDQDRPRNPGNADLSGLGIFLGGMDAAEMHAGFQGTVHPFFVRMENPYVTTSAELEKKVAASGAEAFKKRLMDLSGHDGIIIKDRGHVVVFNPNQVKSAEQNTGAFSTENNDVRFSMGGKVADDPKLAAERQRVLGEQANRIIETVAKKGLTGAAEQNLFASMAEGLDIVDTADADLRTKAWDWFKSLPKAVARKSLGALTLRQLRDVFAKNIPQMDTFYQASRDIAADANRLMTAADEVYNKWAKLDKRNAKIMSELMIRATIAGVNPDVADFEPRANIKQLREGMNKNLARIAEIRAKGKAATDEEAAERMNLESKTRDKADRIQNEVKRRSEFEKISVMYRNLSPAAKEVYQAVKKQYTDNLNDLFEALEARITRQIKDPKQRKHALDAIRLRYDKYIQEGPYFPLSRFGDYIAIAEKNGGASREVRTFDSMAERTRYTRARRAEGWTVQEKTKKEYSRETQGASGSFFEGVIKIIQASEGIDTAERKVLIDEVNQHFIKSMPDLSHRKHFVHRRKVEGYSRDQMRAFADNMQHAAHHIARIRHADKMTAAVESILAESRMLDKDANGDAYVDLHNELTKRLEIMNNPDISPVTQAITAFGFLMNIGPSIASALVNMSQTPLVAFPVLATRFKGIGSISAMNALMKASADYFTSKPKLATGPSLLDNTKLPQEERDMIRALIDDGTIDVTQAHSLAQAAGNDYFNLARTKYGHVGARAMRLVSYPFHVAELANRKITALAAYRMARQNDMGHLAAVSQAREVVLDSHFDYSAHNRARWMEGNTRRVLLLFKQYSQQMTWLLGRSFHQAAKGESKEVRQAAAKQLGMILAGHFIVAGAMGMPVLGGMIGTLSFLANLAGDDDEPKDLEVSIRNFLADTLGQAGGDAVMNGPWRMLPGLGQLDLSNRMSLGDLWFRAPNKEMEGRDQFNQYVNLLLGPVATNAANLFMGANSMANGEVWRGIEMMLPKAVKDGMKAMRYSTEGVKNWKHDTLLEDLGAVELFGQALGFTPSRVSEMYAGANAVKNHETRLERRRQVLMNRWVNAIRERDTEKAREAMAAITAFNAKNPIFRIDYRRNLIPSLRNRMKAQAQTKEGVYVPATRNEIRQVGRFANI
ncbi:MAG: PLxRFG domain-containing protein [Desulfofustis sp.]|jgi:N12 class adenine-specific DNA methylase|nr:PLxRFG domain-containing protein [Desulfofustis sp.]